MKKSYILLALAVLASKWAFLQPPCNEPTLETLPPVALCQGDCFEFDGFQHCNDTTVLKFDLANCKWIAQQIVVNPIKVENLGVVAGVKCTKPCVEYLGETFCKPGYYSKKVGCTVKKFEIAQIKDTIDLGKAAKLTCTKSKVEVLNKSYATGGWHYQQDACTFWKFLIETDYTKPYIYGLTEVCQDAVSFKLSFHVLEATPPYSVDGQPLSSNFFSTELPSGLPYSFNVKSLSSGCKNAAAGIHDCSSPIGPTDGGLAALDAPPSKETPGANKPENQPKNIDDLAPTFTPKGQIEKFYAPNVLKINALSPNDRFTLFSGSESIRQIRRLEVFNADGKPLFRKTAFLPSDPSLGWDGLSAKIRPSDGPRTFEWLAEIELETGEKKVVRGQLTVVP